VYEKNSSESLTTKETSSTTTPPNEKSPCYRCIFPIPPPPETVTNCSDGGVLGVVPGLLGCLQALEALKILAGLGTSYAQKMLLVEALSGSFRTIRLRPRRKDCPVCGNSPTITELIDYVQFCGSSPTDKVSLLHDKPCMTWL
jgi:adenylyltransferase/sulfurtransferase